MFSLNGVVAPLFTSLHRMLTSSFISEKRRRIIALDILRGLFLVVLIADHIPWSPSLYSLVTGQGLLFASAAEGFFVVSGILVGYIYGHKIMGSRKKTIQHIWKRALLLYVISVIGTLTYTLIALWSSPNNIVGLPLWPSDLQSYLLNTFTLRYSYGWTDFLNRYAVFMFAAPAVLWLLSKQKAWLVLPASITIWLFLRDVALFMPFSGWQIIFVLGIVIGYYLPNIEHATKTIPHTIKRSGLFILTSLSAITFVVSVVSAVIIPYLLTLPGITLFDPVVLGQLEALRNSVWDSWFSKSSVAPGRLIVGGLWFSTLYILVRKYEQNIIDQTIGKKVEYLGKHSLYVYVSHGVVVMATYFLLPPSINPGNILLSTIVITTALFCVYMLAKHRNLFDSLISNSRGRINREKF